MKQCPYCAEEIQDAAIVCKHCGRDLAPTTAGKPLVPDQPKPELKKKTSPAAWGCLTIIVLIVIGWCGSLMAPRSSGPPAATGTAAPSPSPPAAAPAVPTYELALLSARGYESDGGGYHIVEGRVKNVTDHPLPHVAAKANWFDKGGNFITSDDALIDYDPLLPGQTSTFKTMSRSNPVMAKFSVEFKYLFGTAIETDDQRRKPK